MLESILALYRPQRYLLPKTYPLPLSIKKSILSICTLYSSSQSDTQSKKRHRNWSLQLSTKYGESCNKIMRVGNAIFPFTVLFCVAMRNRVRESEVS